MKEELITLDTAKLAKEKGFDITTKSFYGCDNPSSGIEPNKLITIELKKEGVVQSQEGTYVYNAPTQSLLQKWIREVHNIHIIIGIFYFIDSNTTGYNVEEIVELDTYIIICHNPTVTYEESLELGLQRALRLIE